MSSIADRKDEETLLEEDGEFNRLKRAIKSDIITCEYEMNLAKKYPQPNDVEWTSGLFDCFDDQDSCIMGLLCPCIMHGKNTETLRGIPWKFGCAIHSMYFGSIITLTSSLAFCHGAMSFGTFVCLSESLVFCFFFGTSHVTRNRAIMRTRYHLKRHMCRGCWEDDEFVHCYCHNCALCQEHREMKIRIRVNSGESNTAAIRPMTIPPPIQAMIAHDSASLLKD